MFKLIRKKLLEGIIKDLAAKIPEIQDHAKIFIELHKDEIIEKVKEAIIKAIKAFIISKLGQKK